MKNVLSSFAYNFDFLREQVADVPANEMVAQPHGIANHPSWVIGHLAYSCQALGGEIGLADWLPTTWRDQYGTGSAPVSDANFYDDKYQALEVLRDAQLRITQAVERLDEAQLNMPLPDEDFRIVLPTIGHAITQILVAHSANHVGQLTVWRRVMGMPPVMRPFA